MTASTDLTIRKLEKRKGLIAQLIKYFWKRIVAWISTGIRLVSQTVSFVADQITLFWNWLESFVQKQIAAASKQPLKSE